MFGLYLLEQTSSQQLLVSCTVEKLPAVLAPTAVPCCRKLEGNHVTLFRLGPGHMTAIPSMVVYVSAAPNPYLLAIQQKSIVKQSDFMTIYDISLLESRLQACNTSLL